MSLYICVRCIKNSKIFCCRLLRCVECNERYDECDKKTRARRDIVEASIAAVHPSNICSVPDRSPGTDTSNARMKNKHRWYLITHHHIVLDIRYKCIRKIARNGSGEISKNIGATWTRRSVVGGRWRRAQQVFLCKMDVREQACREHPLNGSFSAHEKFCQLIFDGFLCWMATRAGELAHQPCPSARASDSIVNTVSVF